MFALKGNPESLANYTLTQATTTDKYHILKVTSRDKSHSRTLKAFLKDDESQQAYLRENRIHSSLSHQNIIQYIANPSYKHSNTLFSTILMEHASYGDFFNLTTDFSFTNEKLVRTYFHQIIDGLTYLHSRGIAHLDLKLDNLLLADNFILKICDFDLAQEVSERLIVSRGTMNYRAPEFLSDSPDIKCNELFAADIYSVGVCLFSLITGAFPFMEEVDASGQNKTLFRYNSYCSQNEEFWKENDALMEGRATFSADLKTLLNKMWRENPKERPTLIEIRKSKWFNEPIYTKDELKTMMGNTLLNQRK